MPGQCVYLSPDFRKVTIIIDSAFKSRLSMGSLSTPPTRCHIHTNMHIRLNLFAEEINLLIL